MAEDRGRGREAISAGRAPVVVVELPEHGSLELPLAGVASRGVAALLDSLLLVSLPLALAFAALVVWPELADESAFHGILVALLMLLLWAGPLALELVQRGSSPGKRRAGLRVMSLDGHPPGRQQIVIRNLLRLVDFLPFGYLLGVAVLFISPRGQRLGDVAAGTLVVRAGARAVEDAGPASEAPVGPEHSGIPASLLRAARALSDPGRKLDESIVLRRRQELLAAARRARPDLSGQGDEELWAFLRRGLG